MLGACIASQREQKNPSPLCCPHFQHCLLSNRPVTTSGALLLQNLPDINRSGVLLLLHEAEPYVYTSASPDDLAGRVLLNTGTIRFILEGNWSCAGQKAGPSFGKLRKGKYAYCSKSMLVASEHPCLPLVSLSLHSWCHRLPTVGPGTSREEELLSLGLAGLGSWWSWHW